MSREQEGRQLGTDVYSSFGGGKVILRYCIR